MLHDHAADRMADQHRSFCAERFKEVREGRGETRDRGCGERLRAAIARHIPGQRPPVAAEMLQLPHPAPRRAPDTVQEHDRVRVRVPCLKVAEAPVTRDSRKDRTQGAPCLAGAILLRRGAVETPPAMDWLALLRRFLAALLPPFQCVEQLRFAPLRHRDRALLDRAEAADLFRKAQEFEHDRWVALAENREQLSDQGLVLLHELPLRPALGAVAEGMESGAA